MCPGRLLATPQRCLFTRAPAALRPAAALMATAQPTGLEYQAFIPGLLHRISYCNNGAQAASKFMPLTVAGATVGYIRPTFARQHLLQFPDIFQESSGSIKVHSQLATQQERTAAITAVLGKLYGQGLIDGWRDELYPAVQSFHDEPAFLLERAAAPHFGIKAYGVHINGYVTLPNGDKELWVARRSRSKPTWPGKLDHIAAGGQPHGLSCQENVIKECQEEASIPPELAAKAIATGAVSYTSLQSAGLKRDVLYCYDLELPLDFVPQPQDGEVEEFIRLPIHRVAELMTATDEFKENCMLVICTFLIRHGFLTPDMPGYLDLVRRLTSGDCS